MIISKVIADSTANGIRLTTLELNYPRFIHSEVMTHRMFSRNASSSRAIPIEKMMLQVLDTPATPISWGKNKPGMQADITLDEWGKSTCKNIWLNASRDAIKSAKYLAEQGLHKQVANRLLEPFQWIKVIVTATEWDNFFKLRLHPDAQPEIQELARVMFSALQASKPIEMKEGDWHHPFGIGSSLEDNIKTSVAGCARVSYNNHDGSTRDIYKDVGLHDTLLSDGHMSCFEHQLTPMTEDELYVCSQASKWIGDCAYFRRNFNRWTSYRWMIENKKENSIFAG